MSREYCFHCTKPINACFCHKIHQYSTDSQIIILQHPTEKGHPLGTAQIAKLSFDKCQIFAGEDFSNHQAINQMIKNQNCFLVFPENSLESPNTAMPKKNCTLIFLDGTWRKCKKMLFISKNLQQLPRISFKPTSTSRYVLRKQPSSNYLSTLEAICSTIKIVEGKDVSQTLETLDYIQKYQIEKMGQERFENNYLKD